MSSCPTRAAALSVALSLTVALCAARPATAQQFVQLPDHTWVNDITPDGSIVVGTGPTGGFYWDWRNDPAPVDIGGYSAVGVSDDGTWITGNIYDPGTGAEVAGRWSAVTGWQNLGYLPNALSCPTRSEATDISGDGSTVVGLSWDSCTGRGFIWTQAGGMQQLQHQGSGDNLANAISANGMEVGGFAVGIVYDRTPSVWDASNGNGYTINFDDAGEVVSFTGDGTSFVGNYLFNPGDTYHAGLGDPATGFTLDLGTLNPDWGAVGTDISEDGSVVCGFDHKDLDREAWVWKPTTGIVSLEDILVGLGFTPSAGALQTATAMSDDGKVVVGGGASNSPFSFTAGYIAELAPQDSPWENLGGDTNGINGRPLLTGKGKLLAGTPTHIDLERGPSGAISVVWTSLTSTPIPLAGGTLHAIPYASEILIPLNGSGEFHAAFPWFAGVPSGLGLHFQFIIQDLSRVYGYSLSNGLKATAP